MEDDWWKPIAYALVILIIITYSVALFNFSSLQMSPQEEKDTPRGDISVTGKILDNQTGTLTIRITEIAPKETIYCSSPNDAVTYQTRSKDILNDSSEEVFATRTGEILIISNVTVGTKINCYSIYTDGDIPSELKEKPVLIESYIAGDVTFI